MIKGQIYEDVQVKASFTMRLEEADLLDDPIPAAEKLIRGALEISGLDTTESKLKIEVTSKGPKIAS